MQRHDVAEGEHILNRSNSGPHVRDNAPAEVVREVDAESSPDNDLTNKHVPTSIQKTATLANGPGRSTRPAQWGRAPVSIICCLHTFGPVLAITLTYFRDPY